MTVAVLRYTVLRLAIFVASLFLLYLIGVRKSLLMLVIAALVSVILSFLLLGGPRDQLAQELAARVEERATRKRRVGIEEDADAEDAAVDAAVDATRAEDVAAADDAAQDRAKKTR